MRAVVLGHTGGTFCAGADLSEASGGDAAETVAENARQLTSVLRSILEMPQPVIGAIDGHVRAGGLGLVGACDIVVAGRNSTFALTEARIGVAPSIISLTLLPKMSARAAGRYFVTGEKFGADEAAEMGLVTIAVDDVDVAVAELTAEIAKGSPQGLAASKALTTVPILNAFQTAGRGADQAVRRACSCPTRPARECWPFCRSARRTGCQIAVGPAIHAFQSKQSLPASLSTRSLRELAYGLRVSRTRRCGSNRRVRMDWFSVADVDGRQPLQ